jgi:hypothetical protein
VPFLLVLLVALSPVLLQRSSVEAASIVVNSTADLSDSYLDDGICDTANFPFSRQGRPPIPPSGICTLRAALMQANSTLLPDAITFNIPGPGPHIIAPATLLPTISSPVVINAATQPGYFGTPKIELNGINVPPPTPTGLVLPGSSTLRGLAIYGFGGVGLLLWPGGGNVVEGNFIGVSASGTDVPGNGLDGIRIDGSSDNRIGGTTDAARNVIAGNRENGVGIFGDPGLPAVGNRVQGNYIGTDAAGVGRFANLLDGVRIEGVSTNTVGGTTPAERNVISGNGKSGISIVGVGATNNRVLGNYIGTSASGAVALGNTLSGVFFGGSASNNTVGGPQISEDNRIAFNGEAGVLVQSGDRNLIRANSIFSNTGLGIDIGDPGVTPNDAADADAGANALQNFPGLNTVVLGVTVDVLGHFNGTPNENFDLQFYSSPHCHSSGHGEGKNFIRTISSRTDGRGALTFFTQLGALSDGDFITATVTDSRNNTSEFSACLKVAGARVPGPTPTPTRTVDPERRPPALIPPSPTPTPTAKPPTPAPTPLEKQPQTPKPPTPTAPVPPESPPPEPPPVVTECPTAYVGGEFEPSQGVWQDDDTFPDQEGKQLRRISDTEWEAELDMVTGRATRLFGIERTQHLDITVFVKALGTVMVPVRFEFFQTDARGRRLIYQTDPVGSIPLDSPCATDASGPNLILKAQTDRGIPPYPENAFSFAGPGDYTLELEVARADGGRTNLPKITVHGRVVDTNRPIFGFVPFQLRGGNVGAGLLAQTRRLADEMPLLRDYFPIASGPRAISPEVTSAQLRDLGDTLGRKDEEILESLRREERATGGVTIRMIEERPPGGISRLFLAQARRAVLNDFFGSSAIRVAADRMVLVMSREDFDILLGQEGSSGFTVAGSRKVIYVVADVDHFSVAHEFAHTTGTAQTFHPFLWSDEDMESECKIRSYHNRALPWADGVNIRTGEIMEDRVPVMGPAVDGKWITQCTYLHLLDRLQRRIDPEVLLVRGILSRGTQALGSLLPAYELQGDADLEAESSGDYAIVLRNASGAELGRYPFIPEWTLPTHPPTERDLISFLYRVPRLPGVAQIDLLGPGDVLDSLRFSANAPSVAITTPNQDTAVQPADGMVTVTWTGTDVDGDALAYTVLYSSDGGETWQLRAFEQSDSEAAVVIDPNVTNHKVKIIANDGAQSAEAVWEFTLAGPLTLAEPLTRTPEDQGGVPTYLWAVLGVLAALLAGASVWWLRRRHRVPTGRPDR